MWSSIANDSSWTLFSNIHALLKFIAVITKIQPSRLDLDALKHLNNNNNII